jgi:hypothetical protein
MRIPFLMFAAVLPLLSGCISDRASLPIGEKQSLTVVRKQTYPWSSEVMRAVVVMNMPDCMVRYRLPPDSGNAGKIEVFVAGGGTFVLRDALGQYRATLADCGMALETRSGDAPGSPAGAFEVGAAGALRFAAGNR